MQDCPGNGNNIATISVSAYRCTCLASIASIRANSSTMGMRRPKVRTWRPISSVTWVLPSKSTKRLALIWLRARATSSSLTCTGRGHRHTLRHHGVQERDLHREWETAQPLPHHRKERATSNLSQLSDFREDQVDQVIQATMLRHQVGAKETGVGVGSAEAHHGVALEGVVRGDARAQGGRQVLARASGHIVGAWCKTPQDSPTPQSSIEQRCCILTKWARTLARKNVDELLCAHTAGHLASKRLRTCRGEEQLTQQLLHDHQSQGVRVIEPTSADSKCDMGQREVIVGDAQVVADKHRLLGLHRNALNIGQRQNPITLPLHTILPTTVQFQVAAPRPLPHHFPPKSGLTET